MFTTPEILLNKARGLANTDALAVQALLLHRSAMRTLLPIHEEMDDDGTFVDIDGIDIPWPSTPEFYQFIPRSFTVEKNGEMFFDIRAAADTAYIHDLATVNRVVEKAEEVARKGNLWALSLGMLDAICHSRSKIVSVQLSRPEDDEEWPLDPDAYVLPLEVSSETLEEAGFDMDSGGVWSFTFGEVNDIVARFDLPEGIDGDLSQVVDMFPAGLPSLIARGALLPDATASDVDSNRSGN